MQQNDRSLADGAGGEIMEYLSDTIEESGLAEHIRYGHQIAAASWSSAAGRWAVRCENGAAFSCRSAGRYPAAVLSPPFHCPPLTACTVHCVSLPTPPSGCESAAKVVKGGAGRAVPRRRCGR